MRRRAEVSRHLQREPGTGRQRAEPSRQQLRVLGHPLQHRVADHDVGVGLGRPVDDVDLLRVDAALPGGGHHVRGGVERGDPGLGPPIAQQRGQVPGTAAEVDHAPWRAGPDPGSPDAGEQVVERARPVVVEVEVERRFPAGARHRARPSVRATSAAIWRTAAGSVPGSARTCSIVPSRPGTLRWTNQAPPAGRRRNASRRAGRGGGGTGSRRSPARARPPAPGPVRPAAGAAPEGPRSAPLPRPSRPPWPRRA